MSKVRTKKYDKHKRAQLFFSNCRLWSWETMIDDGIRYSHGEVYRVPIWQELTQKQVAGLKSKNNNWVVCCRVICIDKNGESYIDSDSRSLRGVKLNELAPIYEQMLTEVLECIPSEDIVDIGWICQSFNKVDKVDTDFFMKHLGEITVERRAKWLQVTT